MFLSKRGKLSQNEVGRWECPGGVLEFGEGFKECLVREIKEEFDFEIEPLEMLESVNHLIPNEKQHWVAICFVSKIKSGKPKILEPEKCEEFGWFSLSEMEKMNVTLPAGNRLKQIRQKYPKGLPNLY